LKGKSRVLFPFRAFKLDRFGRKPDFGAAICHLRAELNTCTPRPFFLLQPQKVMATSDTMHRATDIAVSAVAAPISDIRAAICAQPDPHQAIK